MTNQVKLKDVRQGKTFYKVYAFPELKTAYVRVINVKGKPYTSKHTNSSFVNTFYILEDLRMHSSSISLMDCGVIPNSYNSHKTFYTRKAAQRYVDRVGAGRLTVEERNKSERIEEHKRGWVDFDRKFCDCAD